MEGGLTGAVALVAASEADLGAYHLGEAEVLGEAEAVPAGDPFLGGPMKTALESQPLHGAA